MLVIDKQRTYVCRCAWKDLQITQVMWNQWPKPNLNDLGCLGESILNHKRKFASNENVIRIMSSSARHAPYSFTLHSTHTHTHASHTDILNVKTSFAWKTWIKNVLTIRFPFSETFYHHRCFVLFKNANTFIHMNISMLFRTLFFPSPCIFSYPWLNSIFQSFRSISNDCAMFAHHLLYRYSRIVVDHYPNITHRKQSQTLYSSQIHWVFFRGRGLSIDPVDYYIDRKKKTLRTPNT